MVNDQGYASMTSAKRAAQRANIANPHFTRNEQGRIIVKAANGRPPTVSTVSSPVEKFREIFQAHAKKLRRAEILDLAVEAGIAKNTAATYYQKLRHN